MANTTDKLFMYEGPVHGEGGYIRDEKMYTTAPTLKKAISNFRFRVRKNVDKYANIDCSCIHEVTDA